MENWRDEELKRWRERGHAFINVLHNNVILINY